PFPSGVIAKYAEESMWQLSVSETDADAWPEIQAVNSFNEAPAAGLNYISAILTITTEAGSEPEGADPGASLSAEYVTASGRTYDAVLCNMIVPPSPGSIYDVGVMFPGATADVYLCATVPTDDVIDGAWRVGYLGSSDAVFFAGATQ